MILKGAPLRNFVTVFSVFFRSPNFSFDIYQYKRHGHRCNLPWEFQHILLILVIHKRIKPKCPSLRYAIECIKCEIYAFLSDMKTFGSVHSAEKGHWGISWTHHSGDIYDPEASRAHESLTTSRQVKECHWCLNDASLLYTFYDEKARRNGNFNGKIWSYIYFFKS